MTWPSVGLGSSGRGARCPARGRRAQYPQTSASGPRTDEDEGQHVGDGRERHAKVSVDSIARSNGHADRRYASEGDSRAREDGASAAARHLAQDHDGVDDDDEE